MIDKVSEEPLDLDMDLTLTWCLNAKNSPPNIHGFSSFQLVFGQNPKLPSTFANKHSFNMILVRLLLITQQPYIKQDKHLFRENYHRKYEEL